MTVAMLTDAFLSITQHADWRSGSSAKLKLLCLWDVVLAERISPSPRSPDILPLLALQNNA
jgi:hypothetical protein